MTVPKIGEIPDFRNAGVCADKTVPLDLHYPVGNTSRRGSAPWLQANEAKKVCARCPVAALCLQWALDRNEGWGVWGGMTELERRALKRRGTKPVEVPAQRQPQNDNQPQLELPLQEVTAA